MMYSIDSVIREDNNMFFMFNAKKRRELDAKRAQEAEKIVADTVKELKKATKAVDAVNQRAVNQIGVYDIAEKLYYATRRNKHV
jgi:hypothetical protein